MGAAARPAGRPRSRAGQPEFYSASRGRFARILFRPPRPRRDAEPEGRNPGVASDPAFAWRGQTWYRMPADSNQPLNPRWYLEKKRTEFQLFFLLCPVFARHVAVDRRNPDRILSVAPDPPGGSWNCRRRGAVRDDRGHRIRCLRAPGTRDHPVSQAMDFGGAKTLTATSGAQGPAPRGVLP